MIYKVKHKNKEYFVKAKDEASAVNKVQEHLNKDIEDDRLSPMTYSKLKEMGYTSDDWKKWTQEQANQIVARGRKETQKASKNKEQENSAQGKKSASSENSSSSNNSGNIEQDVKKKLNSANKVFNKYKNEDLGGIGQMKEFGYDSLADYHDETFGTLEYLPKSLRNAEIVDFGFITKAPEEQVRKEIKEQYDNAGPEGAGDIEFSDEHIYDLGDGRTLVLETPGHDFDRDAVDKFYKEVDDVFKNSGKTNNGGNSRVSRISSEQAEKEYNDLVKGTLGGKENRIKVELDNRSAPSSMAPGSREIIEFFDKRRNDNADRLMRNKEVNSVVNSFIKAIEDNKWNSPYENKDLNVLLAAKRAPLSEIEKIYEELGGDKMLNTVNSGRDSFAGGSSYKDNENAKKLNNYARTMFNLRSTIIEMKKQGLSRYKKSLYTLV